jgi:hypothetical protein
MNKVLVHSEWDRGSSRLRRNRAPARAGARVQRSICVEPAAFVADWRAKTVPQHAT